MSEGPVVVFGGGTLGAAVARLGAASGRPVIVASRTARPHSGWWRRWQALDGAPLGWMPPSATVIVALGPGRGETPEASWGSGLSALIGRLSTFRPARVLVCGPASGNAPSIACFEATTRVLPVDTLRLPPLFGPGEGPVAAAMVVLRGGGTVSVGDLPAVRWLCADDAARVALAMAPGDGRVELTGDTPLSPSAMVERLVQRFGGRARAPVWGKGIGGDQASRLAAWSALADHWAPRWGERTPFDAWVDRLPGPRRRQGPWVAGSSTAPTG